MKSIGNKEKVINLDDLFIIQDRIEDIIIAINKDSNTNNLDACNECIEFINFYSKSSLKGMISTFFKDEIKLIINSSINLSIFFVSILYYLSKNNITYSYLISTINNILYLLKYNLALYVKKIQIYYEMELGKYNLNYFKPFNSFLDKLNINDIEKEDDIVEKINKNCILITNDMKTLINYIMDLNSHIFFVEIFNNLSYIKETDLLAYFEIKIKNLNFSKNNAIFNTSNNNDYKLFNSSTYKKNIKMGGIYKKTHISPLKKRKEKEKKRLIKKPYIVTPPTKKYTLVLDLNKTLAFFDTKSKRISLRNGLFSFLSILKPYYELISFSCEPNEINEKIIREIELQKKYFDYHLNDEYSISYNNTLVKPISCLGRDIFRIIIIDDDEKSFQLTKENGIKISEYNGNNQFDNSLHELQKILILIYQKNYDDIRKGIKEFAHEIMEKVSLEKSK